MLENAIWKNPNKWAEKTVGTKNKYLLLLLMHLVLGFGSILIFSLSSNRIFGYYFHPFNIILFIGMILMPLMYLFALRKLLLKLREYNKK